MKLDAAWLREPPLSDLLATLDRDGEEARVVGGAVRNALLGLPHGDIDFVKRHLQQRIAHRAADHARFLAGAVEHFEQPR